MADLKTGKIGKTIRSFPDIIYSDDLPQNAAVTSDELLLGRTQNALEIIVEAEGTLTLADTKVLTVEYLYGAAFAESIELFSFTAAVLGDLTVDAGVLARFVPPSDLGSEAKIRITTDDAAADGVLTVFASLISR